VGTLEMRIAARDQPARSPEEAGLPIGSRY
jgi:hypothetical protein